MHLVTGLLTVMTGGLEEQAQHDLLPVGEFPSRPDPVGASLHRFRQRLFLRDALFPTQDQLEGVEALSEGRPVCGGLGAKRCPARLVDRGEEGVLGQHLVEALRVQVEDGDPFAPGPGERLGERGVEGVPDPLQVRHAADEKDAFVLRGELLQAVRHAALAAQVLLARGDVPVEFRHLPVEGLEADALHRVGVRQVFRVRRVGVEVDVDEVQRDLALQGEPRPLDQRVGGLYEQEDGLGGYMVGEDGDLGEAPDAAQELFFQRLRQLESDAVGLHAVERLAHQVGELHPVVQNGEGVDVAELFQVESVGHNSSATSGSAAPLRRGSARRRAAGARAGPCWSPTSSSGHSGRC